MTAAAMAATHRYRLFIVNILSESKSGRCRPPIGSGQVLWWRRVWRAWRSRHQRCQCLHMVRVQHEAMRRGDTVKAVCRWDAADTVMHGRGLNGGGRMMQLAMIHCHDGRRQRLRAMRRCHRRKGEAGDQQGEQQAHIHAYMQDRTPPCQPLSQENGRFPSRAPVWSLAAFRRERRSMRGGRSACNGPPRQAAFVPFARTRHR